MGFLTDVRYAVRGFIRAPALAMTAATVLGLGIGANTAIFSVVNGVIVRPLPYHDPDRLVAVSYSTRFGPVVPSPIYLAWSEESRRSVGVAAYNRGELTLLHPTGEQVRLSAAWVTESFLSVLAAPHELLGSTFGPDDYKAGAPVVLLSHQAWVTQFAADKGIVGRTIQLRGSGYQVIGVTARQFRFPGFDTPDVILPLILPRDAGAVRLLQGLIVRMGPGVTPASAQAELGTIASRAAHGFDATLRSIVSEPGLPHVMPLQRAIAGDLSLALIAALGAALFLLLLACANVASLLVGRSIGRTRELAIRAALGATAAQLTRSLVAEAVTLAVVGGVTGVSVVALSMGSLRHLLFTSAPQAGTISVDVNVLMFGFALTVATALIVAVIPAVRLAKGNIGSSLRHGGSVGAPAVSRIPASVRTSLLTAQVTLSVILLVGDMLFAASLWQLTSVPLGVEPAQVLTCRLSAKGLGKDENAMLAEVLNRLGVLPRVTAVGATTALPLAGHGFSFVIAIKGMPAPRPDEPSTSVDVVSTDYFRTLRATLDAGRDFEAADTASSRQVAIINQAFARQYSPGRDVVGRQLSLGGRPDDANVAVVGVVRDILDGAPGERVRPTVYRPFTQAAPQIGWHTAMLVARTDGDPVALAQPIKDAIAQIAPSAAVYDCDTLEHRVRATIASPRERAILFGWFAVVAVVLTGVGLYGFLTCWVRESLHEFGIRLTCGATRGTIARLVLIKALVPALWGIIFGVAGALLTSRVVEGLLFGVTSRHFGSYLASTTAIVVITLVASVIPARRAARTDPLVLIKAV